MTNVLVTGRVGTDPELRYTPSGAPVLNFQLAEDHRRYNEQTKEWEKLGTTWRSVSVWARGLMKPEYLHTVISKGQSLTVQGSERLREWETQDGAKGKTLELSASLVAVPLYPPRDTNATAPAGGFAQQTDPWAAQGGANEEPPF